MPFRFRLEKVMKVRRRVVDDRSRAVGEAGRLVTAIERRLEFLGEDIRRCTGGSPAVQTISLNVESLLGRSLWLSHLHDRQRLLAEELAAANDQLEERRRHLTAAWRDLEVLEKLKRKQREQWTVEQAKRERKDLDEVGQIRAENMRRGGLRKSAAQRTKIPLKGKMFRIDQF